MAKPKVKEVIVVEGRYDKNTLSQVVDAVIVELGGFAVFNDKEKQAFLRKLAKERGIILFTDPDGAGFVIRNRVKGNIPEGRVLQAYVPDIYGKEKRKRKGGKEGKLSFVKENSPLCPVPCWHAGIISLFIGRAFQALPCSSAN